MTRQSGVFEATADFVGAAPLGVWSCAASDLGQWTIGSAATEWDGISGHWAQCRQSVKGQLIANGSPMDVPFRVEIAEIR